VRFLSYLAGRDVHFGAVIEDRVVDLSERMPEYPSLRHVLDAGALVRAQDVAVSASADFDLKALRYAPVIANARKIICVGVNYPGRHTGGRHASGDSTHPTPEYPSMFLRTRESLVGHDQPVLKAPEVEQLDYGGEIVLVIGKEGRRIAEENALSHVAGVTLMNEGSARDWMRRGEFNVTQGKNFESSGSLGPWLVTRDECPPLDQLTLTTHVNGELRQTGNTRGLNFRFEYLVSYLSTFLRLMPGDLIATGTPAGTGEELDPPRFLKPGDLIEIDVPGIGTLRNPVEAEPVDDR
jgi:2-keto-4-pentenoate hydratase/2-oxohepta-3-ene-1,7-dioic acid hydratase in catechol pathway